MFQTAGLLCCRSELGGAEPAAGVALRRPGRRRRLRARPAARRHLRRLLRP